MRPRVFVLPVVSALLVIVITFARESTVLPSLVENSRPYSSNDVIGCAPAILADIPFDAERKMVPLPGWGSHRWKVKAANDSALYYFNQGLNMFYSFHMQEAKASFLEAQRQDPECAMAYWGESMAEGPFINAPAYNFNNPYVVSILQKAETLATNEREKALIQAQQLRFTTAPGAERQNLLAAYKTAMHTLHEKYPSDTELAVLYADALMLLNPRNWYDSKGAEKEGTTEIVSFLEEILKADPAHPAALHYYVHMVEPSTEPERARDEADRLLPLLPSVAHMVHMPSHIYVRTGDYEKGIRSNKEAVNGYTAYQKVLKGWEGGRYLYFYHNVDMQGANAALMGNYEETKKAYALNLSQFKPADVTYYSNPLMMNVTQFITAQLYLLDVRFGNWKNILLSKRPVTNKPYHQLLWQFGRGMALVKTGSIQAAQQCLSIMENLAKDSSLYLRRPNRSRAIDVVNIASLILKGAISTEQKQWQEAIQLLEEAVRAEDGLLYSEPEDWRLPARHYLGQVYLLKGDPAKAQQIFEEDLLDHPRNYWALNGLYYALLQQNKKAEAVRLQKQYKSSFAAAALIKPLKGAVY